MDKQELKDVFARQKERMKSPIQELADLRESLVGDHQRQVDSTLRLLQESLQDDEESFARLQRTASNTN